MATLSTPNETPSTSMSKITEPAYMEIDGSDPDAASLLKPIEPMSKIAASPRNPWTPGAVARLPWLALLSLVGVLLGLAAVVFVLVYSDGKPIDNWIWQPSTYIAIAVVVVNICLFYCLSEGATTWWWRLATSGTTVGNLHRAWAYGHKFGDAILAGKQMNFLALTCIMVTVAQINNPLFQRATRAVVEPANTSVLLSVKTASEVPLGYTGILSGRGRWPAVFTDNFGDIVNDWNNQAEIPFTGDCEGICYAIIDTLGFDVNCDQSSSPFNLTPSVDANGTMIAETYWIFETGFRWQDGERTSNVINLDMSNKETEECEGRVQIQNCTMQPARVSTHVIIDGNASTISLDPAFSIDDDVIVKPDNRSEDAFVGPSTIGGIYLALNNKYSSDASMYFTAGVSTYFLTTRANTATQYVIRESMGEGPSTSCGLAFRDPKPDLLAGSRDLMFRLAMHAINETTPSQNVIAQQDLQRAVFRSDYAFMAAALAVTATALLMVLGLFTGYQTLGRVVSLSPVEIAKAFDAALLTGADNNAEIEKLIDELGSRQVKYGSVRGLEPMGEEGDMAAKLIMADPMRVGRPRRGETFTG